MAYEIMEIILCIFMIVGIIKWLMDIYMNIIIKIIITNEEIIIKTGDKNSRSKSKSKRKCKN